MALWLLINQGVVYTKLSDCTNFSGIAVTRTMQQKSLVQFFRDLYVCEIYGEMQLTCIKDEGVTESVVPIVTSVDQKLCV